MNKGATGKNIKSAEIFPNKVMELLLQHVNPVRWAQTNARFFYVLKSAAFSFHIGFKYHSFPDQYLSVGSLFSPGSTR